MRRRLHLAAFAGAATFAGGCYGITSHSDCLDYATCEGLQADGDGGPLDAEGGQLDGSADAESGVVAPKDCDLTKSPKDSLPCVADTVGIFASPAGNDADPGTRDKPVRSIARAAALAASSNKPRVYVCTGTYSDSVEVAKPISFHGGFTCTGGDWKYTGDVPIWNAAKADHALRIAGAGDKLAIEDLEFDAKDGSAAGESSIGIFIADSAEVSLTRVVVNAGKGVDGETKVKQSAKGNAPKGGAAVNPIGGAGSKLTCPDGDSIGGNGGTVGANDATAGQPALGQGAAGAGITDCGVGGSGSPGAGGGKGGDAPANALRGALTSAGWAPA
jgi:hypothetical protein